MTDIPQMPPKVAAAIAAVMSDVPKLAKEDKNTHGGYKFTSIDDFLEAVRPLCAKHGLIIAQDEESFEMRDAGVGRDGKPRSWLVVRFAYTLAHSSGETWGHRPTRTIMVDASMGSQAFGAAQSYSLKQFQRSLFQIATGEASEDADAHPPADLPKNVRREAKRGQMQGPLNITQLKSAMRAFAHDMEGCIELDQLEGLIADNKTVLEQCQRDLPDWYFGVEGSEVKGAQTRISERIADLKNPIHAPLGAG